jgi:iron complex outermembrane recepter protein
MPKRPIALTVLAFTTLSGAGRVGAQDATLEEITVTAQKREETLAQVPIAVSVLSADMIQQRHITSVADLQSLVPDLHVGTSPFQPVVQIRGVGSGGGDRTFEQSVATYVNGVYAGRANQFLNPFFDVDRIEVVRGPQGVLFGVNAVAGGINITNKEPGKKLEGFVSAGYEAYDKGYHYDGAISLPITDTLAVRLAATKGNDGPFLKNQVPGGIKLETGYELLRGILKWEPADDLTVKLSAETSNRNTEGSPFQMYALGINTLPVYGYTIDTAVENGVLDFKRSSATPNEHTNINAADFSLDVSWTVGARHTLRSITGYSKYNFNQAVPAASIPIQLGNALAIDAFSQTYEELRLVSPGDQRLDYVLGAAYYKQNERLYQGIDLVAAGTPVGFRNGLVPDTKSYAIFGQLTFKIADALRVVGGARYSDVQKEANYTLSATDFGAPLNGYAFSPGAAAAIASFTPLGWLTFVDPADPAPQITNHSLRLRKVDPSVSLQGDVNEHVHPYLTFSRATKAGGFDDQNKATALSNFAYAPESARSWELGVKTDFSRWQLNADVFDTRFKNLQVTIPAGNNVVTANAASITSKGFELDALYLLAEHVKLGADLTYLDAKYDDFPGVGCITPLDVLQAIFAPCSIEQVASPSETNAAGKRVEFAPRVTATVRLDATATLSGMLDLAYGGRVYYNDGYGMNANQDPIDRQGGYTLYDAYLGLQAPTGSWNVRLLGKNLGNKPVLEFGGLAGLGAGHQGVVDPGRQLLLNATWNF